MFSLLTSILAMALVAVFLVATVTYLDKPFALTAETQFQMKIAQHYIDFGSLLSSADSLSYGINTIDDARNLNKILPMLDNVNYQYYRAPTGERVFYNTNVSDKDCLTYEMKQQGNKILLFSAITKPITIENYITNNNRNFSCFRSQISGANYIVFIYSYNLG
jgi:hypothetical protein